MCQYGDALIQSEGGYTPTRWAEYAEQHCAWGMFQNNVCVHKNWSLDVARYIYYVLVNKKPNVEYARLKRFDYLLDGDWQIEELLDRFKKRIARTAFKEKWCQNKVIMGEKIHPDIYCAIRLHNWNGRDGYVSRVVSKKQELYPNP